MFIKQFFNDKYHVQKKKLFYLPRSTPSKQIKELKKLLSQVLSSL